jgi:IS30 family transposase
MHHEAMYEADRGIRRSHYYDDDGMTAGQRDELIWKLHQRGLSQGKIARQLGNTITQQGISRALKRIAAGRVGAGPRG